MPKASLRLGTKLMQALLGQRSLSASLFGHCDIILGKRSSDENTSNQIKILIELFARETEMRDSVGSTGFWGFGVL